MDRRAPTNEEKTLEEQLLEHFEADKKNFKKIADDNKTQTDLLKNIEDHMKKNNEFMGSLSWLSDISHATQLLKKPSLWFVAFILGLVALFGGVKALFIGFISLIMPR